MKPQYCRVKSETHSNATASEEGCFCTRIWVNEVVNVEDNLFGSFSLARWGHDCRSCGLERCVIHNPGLASFSFKYMYCAGSLEEKICLQIWRPQDCSFDTESSQPPSIYNKKSGCCFRRIHWKPFFLYRVFASTKNTAQLYSLLNFKNWTWPGSWPLDQNTYPGQPASPATSAFFSPDCTTPGLTCLDVCLFSLLSKWAGGHGGSCQSSQHWGGWGRRIMMRSRAA